MTARDDVFVSWFQALDQRHLSNFNFAEVRRAVQALSSLYVERRERLCGSASLDSAGKRAAFAFFFAPLHFLLVREIVRALPATVPQPFGILDLGCGTGVAGAAWALELEGRPRVIGIDRNSWVLQECNWTYRQLGIRGATRATDLKAVRIPPKTAVIAAFTMNELEAELRLRFCKEFLRSSRRGAPVLVVEPIARGVGRWWDEWAREWVAAGGREDEWRFHADLPERVALMDRAAGLDHRQLTGRSLWLPGSEFQA